MTLTKGDIVKLANHDYQGTFTVTDPKAIVAGKDELHCVIEPTDIWEFADEFLNKAGREKLEEYEAIEMCLPIERVAKV